ncbi:MAG: enoyl-CoA hydratase/isomerase family protein [Spirochaetes bacterium]|nr:enoyl-CoA hydratase/isomerase family protein [Spirochaetota bacterium]
MEQSRLVTWEIQDSIGIMTIDNPPQNRLTDAVFVDPGSLIRWIEDDTLKGIIVIGKGRHFSAGADLDRLREIAADEALLMSSIHDGKELLADFEAIPVPTIAAIEGACFGGGLEIALACHMRICAKNSLLAFPEVNHAIMPGMGGTVRLPGMIGHGKAMEMILGGDIVNASRAKEIGLVDHVTPPKEALQFSLSLMKKMVAQRPVEVIRSIVRALNNSRTMTAQQAMEEETKMFCRLAVKVHE